MTKREQQQWLVNEIKRVVLKSVNEFDFTYVEAIGALEFVKLNLFEDAGRGDDEEPS